MAKELKQSAPPATPYLDRSPAAARERYGNELRFGDDPTGSSGGAILPDAGEMPTPAPGMADLTAEEEQAIRSRAYTFWEEAGRPEGDHETHWHRAREELERQRNERGDAS